jgi:hypothetical protein
VTDYSLFILFLKNGEFCIKSKHCLEPVIYFFHGEFSQKFYLPETKKE